MKKTPKAKPTPPTPPTPQAAYQPPKPLGEMTEAELLALERKLAARREK